MRLTTLQVESAGLDDFICIQVHMEQGWRGRGVRRQVASTHFQDLWLGRLGTLQQHLLKLDVKGKNRDDEFVFPYVEVECYRTTI